MSEISTKVEKLDFEYILEHCLEKKLWEKTWTIFEYGDFTITVNLKRIDIEYNQISLRVKANKKTKNYFMGHNYDCELNIPLSEFHKNLKIFNQKLTASVKNTLALAGRDYLAGSKEVQELKDMQTDWETAIEEACNGLLDYYEIDNARVRKAYIDEKKEANEIDLCWDFKFENDGIPYADVLLAYCLYADDLRYKEELEEIVSNDKEYSYTAIEEDVKGITTGEHIETLKNEIANELGEAEVE